MIEWVKQFIDNYGIFAISLVIMLEYACLPLPSEIVLPMAGVIASKSESLSFSMILTISVCAGIMGCYICYAIGYFGGSKIIDIIKKKFPSTVNGLEKSEQFFLKHSSLAAAFGRLLPLCRTYISLIAGLVKQDIAKFTFASIVGIIVWNSVLISCGYFLGEKWTVILQYYELYKQILIPLVIVVLIVFIYFKFIKTKK